MLGKRMAAVVLAAAMVLMSGCAEAEVILSQLLTEDTASQPQFRTGGTGISTRPAIKNRPAVRSGESLRQSNLKPIEETPFLVEDEPTPAAEAAVSDETAPSTETPSTESASSTEAAPVEDMTDEAASEAVSSEKETVAVSNLDHTVNAAPEENGSSQNAAEDAVQATPAAAEAAPQFPWPAGFMPYRDMLSAQDKLVYDEIYANVSQLKGRFVLNSYATSRSISPIVRAVIYDNPDLFWLDSSYRFGYTADGHVTEVEISFNSTARDFPASKAAFEAAAEQVIQGAAALSSDWDKEQYVHDYLLDLVQYNLNSPNNQSAYSALVGRSSVCAGYAKAFQYIMMRLGIPCYYCVGYAGEDHAWNLIQLDGAFYNVDVAWDDPVGNPQGQYHYDYFNLTDQQIMSDHRRTEMSVYLPASA